MNNLCRKNSEQFFKQCWTENNFMQNTKNSLCRKQWTIFMRKQWTVLINAENRFYECSKQIWICSKHDVAPTVAWVVFWRHVTNLLL